MNKSLVEEYLEDIGEDYEDVRNDYLDSLKASSFFIVHYDLTDLKLDFSISSQG